ncbi:MAG: DUF6242 domain-containing protein [Bacteroidaceae bacterium]|nr:DUF6242 domain-containing protein [Bacteroidaceae bacterium]
MRNLASALASIIILSLIISGCKKEEEVEYSSNCYISSFTLGAMKRVVHVTSSSGSDSTYNVSFTGSLYPLVINQREQTILLRDSLPMGTTVSAVVVSVGFNGVLMHQTWSDEPTEDWITYSSKDSLDFSQPRRFRVIPSDGVGYRDYFVRLDVRTNEATSFTWNPVTDATTLAERASMKATTRDTDIYVLSTDSAGKAFATKSNMTQMPAVWTESACTGLPTNVDVNSLQVFKSKFWITDSVGQMYQSDDCILWSPEATATPLTLIAASDYALYARNAVGTSPLSLCYSTGTGWTPIGIDEEESLFPTTTASVAITQENGIQRVLIAGPKAPTAEGNDSTCAVWSLLERFDEPWTYYSDGSAYVYTLPAMSSLNIVEYNYWLIAFGSRMDADGPTTMCYLSQDNGITWKTFSNLTAPTSISNTTSPITAVASDEYFWVLAGSKVWRVRLNSYGEN